MLAKSCAHGETRRGSSARGILAAGILVLALVTVPMLACAACISVSSVSPNFSYSQAFDTLANTGTENSTVPNGWAFVETGINANTTYAADTGANNAGNTYSYGSSGSPERALGALQSGSLVSMFGACFTNDTGSTVTSIDVGYTGEEWRLGALGRTDELDFQYSTDATTLSDGTWAGVVALKFTTPDTSTTGAKDGNAAGERTVLSSTIDNLSIPAGATFWIRWTDFNASGIDDGLAIDDFMLTVHGSSGSGNPSGNGAATPNSLMAGGNTLLTVAVTPGTNPASSGLTVTANLTVIGGSAAQVFYDDGSHGDVTAGDKMFSFTATVGNAVTAGAKSLPVAIGDSQMRTGTASIALTVTSPPVTIMQIQGSATSSPLAGQTVTTTSNIVTAKRSNGFFMQDPFGDANVGTSDGIFVFTGSAPTVAIGDSVTVVGQVQEFNGITELSSGPIVSVLSTGNPLPAAYVLDGNPPGNDPTTGICPVVPANADTDGHQASNFSCLDGMRVAMNNATVTGPTLALGASAIATGSPAFLYAKLTGGALPYRGIGAIYPGLGAGIPVWNGEPEVIEVYLQGLSGFDGSAAIYNAGSLISVTGIVGTFKAPGATAPTYAILASQIGTIFATPALYLPVADPEPGTLTVATQNLLRFFNASADGADTSTYNDTCAGTGSGDACPTPAQYAIRLSKAAKTICSVLKAPVVAELEEVENRAVLADIALAVLSECNTTYVPYLIPGNDASGINVGLLVRDDVSVNSVTQVYKSTNTVNCSGGGICLLNDRPPLLLDATFNGYRFAVLAIHNRSFGGLGDPASAYVGPKRAEQAAQVAQIARAWQSGATLSGAGDARVDAFGNVTNGSFDIVGLPAVPLIVAGDFNAYEFTDGYVDVTGMIAGTAVASQNVYWFDGNFANTDTPGYLAPSPTLVDTGIKSSSRYSYSFDGIRQEIDHILLTRTAWKSFVAISNAHGNADISAADPAVLSGTTPVRASDHDGQVVTLLTDRVFAGDFESQP